MNRSTKANKLLGMVLVASTLFIAAPSANAVVLAGASGAPGSGGSFGGGTAVGGGGNAPLGGGGAALGGGGAALGGGPTPGGGTAFGNNPTAAQQAFVNSQPTTQLSNGATFINTDALNTGRVQGGGAFGNTVPPGALSGLTNAGFSMGGGGVVGRSTFVGNGFASQGFASQGFTNQGFAPGFNMQGFGMPVGQTLGPVQVNVSSPFATPRATATRQVFMNGLPTVVSSPVVVDYNWPTAKKAKRSKHSLARVIKSKKHSSKRVHKAKHRK